MATLTPTTSTTSPITGIASHVSDLANPHAVTAEQVGALSTGNLDIVVNSTDVTLTATQFSNNSFDVTGTLTANVAIIVPDGVAQSFIVDNLTTGSFTLSVKHSGSAAVTVTQGISQLLYTNGTTVEAVEAASVAHTHTASEVTDFDTAVSASTHGTSTANPHSVTATQVGLANVDNTSDVNKPVSTAQQAALDAKVDETAATGSAVLPSGTTAQRDATPVNGYLRYNSTDGAFEGYAAGAWGAIGGGGGYTWAVKTAAYTAVDNDGILADTTTAAFTVTLPATPADGEKVMVADGASADSWNTNNLTVARNGSTINGLAADYIADVDNGWVEFIYDGTNENTWQVRTAFSSLSSVADISLSNLSATGNDKVCTAWVNFNGTGTVAIRDSFNVSSITDNGIGTYTVNFATAMANANYSVGGSGESTSTNGMTLIVVGTSPPTTTAVRVATDRRSAGVGDSARVSVQIFGGL